MVQFLKIFDLEKCTNTTKTFVCDVIIMFIILNAFVFYINTTGGVKCVFMWFNCFWGTNGEIYKPVYVFLGKRDLLDTDVSAI